MCGLAIPTVGRHAVYMHLVRGGFRSTLMVVWPGEMFSAYRAFTWAIIFCLLVSGDLPLYHLEGPISLRVVHMGL